jgi:hypothetical protein
MTSILSAAAQVMARALRDPRPTTTSKSERQLAIALGYPSTWHVVRRIERMEEESKNIIVDRVYAGNPSSNVDMWFNHDAARQASMEWKEGESTGYEHKGGHLLPRKARFSKGDEVEVHYEGGWYAATIVKRKEYEDGFRYVVYYTEDESNQTGVLEDEIRPAPEKQDPYQLAESLGLPTGWTALLSPKGRWMIQSDDGEHKFRSEKAALNFVKKNGIATAPDGDPPWRTTGNDYLGRKVTWTTIQKVSATRTVDVTQEGEVVGWISETDVDSKGEPGFVSEKTGKPARLFHVVFQDNPHHPYANHLIQSQDLEEFELVDCLLPESESPPKKKSRQSKS